MIFCTMQPIQTGGWRNRLWSSTVSSVFCCIGLDPDSFVALTSDNWSVGSVQGIEAPRNRTMHRKERVISVDTDASHQQSDVLPSSLSATGNGSSNSMTQPVAVRLLPSYQRRKRRRLKVLKVMDDNRDSSTAKYDTADAKPCTTSGPPLTADGVDIGYSDKTRAELAQAHSRHSRFSHPGSLRLHSIQSLRGCYGDRGATTPSRSAPPTTKKIVQDQGQPRKPLIDEPRLPAASTPQNNCFRSGVDSIINVEDYELIELIATRKLKNNKKNKMSHLRNTTTSEQGPEEMKREVWRQSCLSLVLVTSSEQGPRDEEGEGRQLCDRSLCIDCCQRLVAFFFTTVGSCCLTVAYVIMGGLLFSALEAGYEISTRNDMRRVQRFHVEWLWNLTTRMNVLHPDNWTNEAEVVFDSYTREVLMTYESFVNKFGVF